MWLDQLLWTCAFFNFFHLQYFHVFMVLVCLLLAVYSFVRIQSYRLCLFTGSFNPITSNPLGLKSKYVSIFSFLPFFLFDFLFVVFVFFLCLLWAFHSFLVSSWSPIEVWLAVFFPLPGRYPGCQNTSLPVSCLELWTIVPHGYGCICTCFRRWVLPTFSVSLFLITANTPPFLRSYAFCWKSLLPNSLWWGLLVEPASWFYLQVIFRGCGTLGSCFLQDLKNVFPLSFYASV